MNAQPEKSNWRIADWAASGAKREVSSGLFGPILQWLKIGLPIVALLVIVVVLVWPLVFSRQTGFRLSGAPNADGTDAYAQMANPIFTGVDKRDQFYTVTADMAVQRRAGEEIFELVRPKADWNRNDGSWMALTAETGRFDKKEKHVDLKGNVNLFQDDGYELVTDAATIDLAAGTSAGDRPVSGQGPKGTIESEGFQVLDKGQVIIFTGKSHLVLFSDGKQDEPAKDRTQ